MSGARRTRAGGFTVLELMVALTVGGVAISSVYAIGAASTRHFREQQRVSNTQSSLRTAMTQIKRDLQRAGYLGTPNVQIAGEACVPPGSTLDTTGGAVGAGRLAAISAYHRSVDRPSNLDPNDLNAWATVDQVILMGNYSTSGEYPGVQLNVTRNAVTIPITSQSFTRDFSNWYQTSGGAPGTCNEPALQSAFRVGRLMRIRGPDERAAYVTITAAVCNVGANLATISFDPALPATCTVDTGYVSPLNTIRYAAVNAGDAEDSLTAEDTVAVLRRTEVNPAAKGNPLTMTAGTGVASVDDRAVLDYLVSFRLQFLIADGTPRTVNFAPAPVATVQSNPERVWGAMIELIARTAEQEPNMPNRIGALPPFRLFDTGERGAARTRSLRAELLLPNIALKGM